MTQAIKLKLEQTAKAEIDSSVWSNHDDSLPLNVAKNALVRFAKTILENPGEWGLFTPDQMRGQRKHNHVETWYESHIQKEKYREVLERLLEENMCSHAGDELIEEALKQK